MNNCVEKDSWWTLFGYEECVNEIVPNTGLPQPITETKKVRFIELSNPTNSIILDEIIPDNKELFTLPCNSTPNNYSTINLYNYNNNINEIGGIYNIYVCV
jgi:hypothetical protein